MNNSEYENILEDVIEACFYSTVKPRIRISSIRLLAEVLIRKLLLIDDSIDITLGGKLVKNGLKNHLIYDPEFAEAFNIMKDLADDCSHTGLKKPVTNDEYKKSLDAIIYIYSYLFIDFFHRNEFNKNMGIVSLFSILPPEIRVYTLSKLLKDEPDNIFILHKLSLARLKLLGLNNTIKWLYNNKDEFDLSDSKLATLHYYKSIIKENVYSTKTVIEHINVNLHLNSALEYLFKNLITTDGNIKREGSRYYSFESAKEFYLKKKSEIHNHTEILDEFLDLMDLCYMGRKMEENPNILKDDQSYITIF
ncbi:TPA: hypothetical protein ACGWHD_004623 [Serratia liquefaciens]